MIGPAGLGSDTLGNASPYGSLIPDNRIDIHGYFDQLEGRIGNGTNLRQGGQGWIGNDSNRLWIKPEGCFGGTEALMRESGGRVNDVRALVGLRTWF